MKAKLWVKVLCFFMLGLLLGGLLGLFLVSTMAPPVAADGSSLLLGTHRSSLRQLTRG